jgi:hypothetical protein
VGGPLPWVHPPAARAPSVLIAVAVALVALGSLPEAVPAQTAVDARYAGHFRQRGSREDARRRVREALAPTLARLNSLVRGRVEARLRERSRVATDIHVGFEEDRIAVRFVGPRRDLPDPRVP